MTVSAPAHVMRPVQSCVREVFSGAVHDAVPAALASGAIINVSNANPKFGDYQCNNAMALQKAFGAEIGTKSPKEMGDLIHSKLGLEGSKLFEDVSVAPQGFVTVKLAPSWIEGKISELLENGVHFSDSPAKRVVIDFSSPNVAKEMHVGHLRSTIIGETASRILEFVGHEVHRVNHIGDWGTQFGMLIEYLKETYPNFLQEMPDIADLQTFYKAAKKRFDDSEEFKKRAQLQVVSLQANDGSPENKAALQAWQAICEVSRKAFSLIYDRLGITLTEKGESYYNEMIAPIVDELEKVGVVKDSNGAKCIFTKVDDVPLIAVKSDGGYGYDSTDLAAVWYRLCVNRADWVIYITDAGQEVHFKKIIDAAEQVGWHRKGTSRLDHMGFGVVLGEDGKKFKTRSGDVVKLSDLLDEAEKRAFDELKSRQEKNQEKAGGDFSGTNLEPEEFKKAASQIGLAAVRYFDLKQNRTTDYRFNYDHMLAPNGNTAVFLLYAYARMCSILRKGGKDMASLKSSALKNVKISHPQERALALEILRFAEVVEAILGDLHLHKLCEFMWDLSNKFSAFYRDCKVVGSEEETSRLLLCEAARMVMEKCFHLLAIQPLERI